MHGGRTRLRNPRTIGVTVLLVFLAFLQVFDIATRPRRVHARLIAAVRRGLTLSEARVPDRAATKPEPRQLIAPGDDRPLSS